jgi:hypothetical protein
MKQEEVMKIENGHPYRIDEETGATIYLKDAIMEMEIGRKLRPDERVVVKNGNPLDCRRENLEIVMQPETKTIVWNHCTLEDTEDSGRQGDYGPDVIVMRNVLDPSGSPIFSVIEGEYAEGTTFDVAITYTVVPPKDQAATRGLEGAVDPASRGTTG